MSKPKRKNWTNEKHLDASLEHDRVVNARRARLEDESAAEFYARHPAQSSTVQTDIFGHRATPENEIDVARAVIQRERQPLVRVVDPETLAKM